MATVTILHNFVDIISEIKKISAKAGVPVGVEIDKDNRGVDGKLILDNIPVIRHDGFYDLEHNMTIEYSAPKKNWEQLLNKMQLLSISLVDDITFLFNGWVKIDDDSKLIYQATIVYKNMLANN